MEGVLDVNLYNSDNIFNDTERILCFGSSCTGKTYLIEKLIQRYAHRFYKIVICGNRNRLLEFEETKHKTQLYHGNNYDEGIYDPLTEIDSYELNKKKKENLQLLIIYDDLMESLYRSPVVSKLYSKGRHLSISVISIMQSYFPTGKGQNLFPQIKNNSTIQIFTKARSQGEIGLIASRLECGKLARDVFINIFKKIVQDKRYGYLAVMLDVADTRLRYCNNINGEDGTPYLTVFI